MDEPKNIAFDFGQNWREFSAHALDREKLTSACESLQHLIPADRLKGAAFLDIGCGSGIFAIAASIGGAARVVGIDISKASVETSKANVQAFGGERDITFQHRSVFDPEIQQLGTFDIVYSWGVLHHTGDMHKAIDIASGLVRPGGLFAIALYNRHWSSGLWKGIKWFYNHVPGFLQRLMVWAFFLVIALAKLLVTRRNPFRRKRRGMSFYYDVVDWVGGYPYEYAGREEVVDYMKRKGFECTRFVKPAVPTGCNEFVFLRGNA
jgi:SAM-dependent methyltransferase